MQKKTKEQQQQQKLKKVNKNKNVFKNNWNENYQKEVSYG